MLDFRSFFKEEKEIGDVAGVEPENVPYLSGGKVPLVRSVLKREGFGEI